MSIIAQPAVHSSWRSYVQEAKCEALQKLREPAYCLPVIGFTAAGSVVHTRRHRSMFEVIKTAPVRCC